LTGTHEELTAADRAVRELLAGAAEAELLAIPGVVHVSVGLKESAGAVTETLAIRVYVKEKKSDDDVPSGERIPHEIGGVPTDVNEVASYGFSVDNARYRPLKGGIQISNRIIDANEAMTGTQISRGTLGCTGTYNVDHSPVLLSNWHVLMANTARVGDRVYQPAPSSLPTVDLADLPLRPTDDTDAIAKIAKFAITDKVDGAIARIDVSSWCRCFGVDFRDEINGVSVGGHPVSNAILGQRPAVAGMKVYKVGMHTGRTAGQVVDPNYPSFDMTRAGTTYTFTGQIQIASDDPAVNFSQHGDSGALVVDNDGFAIGLLFASSSDPPPAGRTIANHIADVCTALSITLNVAHSSHPTTSARIAVPDAAVEADGYRETRERLLREPGGALLLELAEAHREEIANLVSYNRRVTVAWNRGGGPAFVAALANTLRSGGDALPPRIDGTTPAELLAQMAPVLVAHGSADLQEAVQRYAPVLIDAVDRCATLGEAIRMLNEAGTVRR
jgi:hypothetical protein